MNANLGDVGVAAFGGLSLGVFVAAGGLAISFGYAIGGLAIGARTLSGAGADPDLVRWLSRWWPGILEIFPNIN